MANKVDSRYSRYLFFIPAGIAMLAPAFSVAYFRKGNGIDRAFFFVALLLYVSMVAVVVLGRKRRVRR